MPRRTGNFKEVTLTSAEGAVEGQRGGYSQDTVAVHHADALGTEEGHPLTPPA